ncbi:MAG: hypothetical protein ABIS35_01335 [Terracoccus sp.]
MTWLVRRPVPALGAAVLLLAVLAVLAVLAGCSSDGTPAPTTAPISASAPALTPAPGTATSAAGSSTAPSAGAADPVAAYCTALQDEQGELTALSGAVTDREAVQRGVAALQRIEDVAPAEVRPAWGDFIAFAVTAEKGDAAALAGATARLTAASATIAEHAVRTCGSAPLP